ncbi:UNVERIFIED_CONTAM: hypothetical protein DV095_11140, partial [Bifidobacterium breve]|nr:hypothetical protein [Bifidobacterium breve]
SQRDAVNDRSSSGGGDGGAIREGARGEEARGADGREKSSKKREASNEAGGGGVGGGRALANAPRHGQSGPFPVAYNVGPGRRHAPGGVFPPPPLNNRSLNAGPFTGRGWYKGPAQVFGMPVPDSATPPAGGDTETWKEFVSLTGTQA